ncbi:hypothetical protein NM897_16800 (plasmid) [Planococcus maritimus]|uniref:hypothetical protein n=1 Tax=Planococcus maritimus TaxID=192421 RepID=UPI003139BDFB
MRKKRRLLVLLLLSLMMFSGIYYYLSTNSNFEIGASSKIVKKVMEEQETIYFGYQFHFEGYGNPTIENVYVVQTDGTINQPSNQQILITPLIDTSGKIGVLYEEHILEEGLSNSIAPVQGFKSKDHNYNIAFKVELKDESFDQDFHAFIIEYHHLGMLKTQSLDFEGFFSNETAMIVE